MRRWIAGLLVAGLAGCTSMAQNQTEFEQIQKRREAILARSTPPPPPVQAEQVTAENARQVSQDLLNELDRETNQALQAPRGPVRMPN